MKDSETIDEFTAKLTDITSKSAALGEVFEEVKIVKKLLSSVPRAKYIHIVATLEQVLDLRVTGFEDIVGRLKAYEELIRDQEEGHKTQHKLMYANDQPQSSRPAMQPTTRGQGRRGRFAEHGRERSNSRQSRDMIKVMCYCCDKYENYPTSCPDRLLKLQETVDEEEGEDERYEADELMMHEVVFLNEKNIFPKANEKNAEDDMWYIENGASNHMIGSLLYFTKLNRLVTGKVRFGDDSRVDIKGKGSIVFTDINGEARTMTNVYYITDLRNNIVSLRQATQVGCDIRMSNNYLMMHNRTRKLLVRAPSSCNRPYKVRMRMVTEKCLQIELMSNYAL